jgi:hypothetical protein
MDSSGKEHIAVKKKIKCRKRNDNTKKCAVKGCDSKVGGDLKFFQFPKDKKYGGFSPLANLWIFFTRVKGFQPLRTQVLCELHFAPEFINEKGAIKTKSVPTIYYNSDGVKIEVGS